MIIQEMQQLCAYLQVLCLESFLCLKSLVNYFSCLKPNSNADQAVSRANMMKIEGTLMRKRHENCWFRARQRSFTDTEWKKKHKWIMSMIRKKNKTQNIYRQWFCLVLLFPKAGNGKTLIFANLLIDLIKIIITCLYKSMALSKLIRCDTMDIIKTADSFGWMVLRPRVCGSLWNSWAS